MNQTHCKECEARQRKIEQLEKRIEFLLERLKAIREALRLALYEALGIAQHASDKMAEGNKPRAAWSYLKAVHIVARHLGKKIGEIYGATLIN